MRLSDIMGHADLAGYAEVALVLFLLAFLVIAIAVLAPGRAKEWERASRLPLEDPPRQTPPSPGAPPTDPSISPAAGAGARP
jgi:cbb3-type cytochrome oxidase subunit 3